MPSEVESVRIHEKHDKLIEQIKGSPQLFNEKFYPELGFESFEEANVAFLDIYELIIQTIRTDSAKRSNAFNAVVKDIDQLIESKSNVPNGGKIRYIAHKLFVLLETSIALSADDQESSEIFELIKYKLHEYSKQPKGLHFNLFLEEFARQISKLKKESPDNASIMKTYYDSLLNSFPSEMRHKFPNPSLATVKNCESVITKAGQTVSVKKLSKTSEPKYMIAKS